MRPESLRRLLLVLAIAPTLPAVCAAAASAAYLRYSAETTPRYFEFVALTAFETNQVELSWADGNRTRFRVKDAVPIELRGPRTGGVCANVTETRVECDLPAGDKLELRFHLGEYDDLFDGSGFAPGGGPPLVVRVYGLGGDDTLIAPAGGDNFLYGADGDDILIGGAGSDRLYGSSGNDTLVGGPGVDRHRGERGDDVIISLDGVGGEPAFCDEKPDSPVRSGDVAYIDPDDAPRGCGRIFYKMPAFGRRAPWASIAGAPRVSSDGRRVPVRIVCVTPDAGTCSGTVTLQTTGKVRVPGRKGSRVVTLAAGRFRADHGKATTVTLRLGSTARRLLKGRRSLPAKLTLSGMDDTGAARAATKTFSLRRPGGTSAR